eukprot:6607443-Pyramimonas_sp.AAC.3
MPFCLDYQSVLDHAEPYLLYQVTLKDILACGMGDTVVNFFSDYMGFWRYENREMLMQQEQEE